MKRKYQEKPISHKRLTRNKAGSIILEDGYKITKKQQKELRNLVNKLNARRESIISKTSKDVQNKYKAFGYDSDLLYRHRNLRYNELNTEEKYKKFLRQLKAIDTGTDFRKNVPIYKDNYKKGLIDAFGKEKGKALGNIVDKINQDKFADAIISEELEDVGYLYSEEQVSEEYKKIEGKLHNLAKRK